MLWCNKHLGYKRRIPCSISLIFFLCSSNLSSCLAFSSFIWPSSSLFGMSNWSCRARYIFCFPYSLNEICSLSARASSAFWTAVFLRLYFCSESAAFWEFNGLFCWIEGYKNSKVNLEQQPKHQFTLYGSLAIYNSSSVCLVTNY